MNALGKRKERKWKRGKKKEKEKRRPSCNAKAGELVGDARQVRVVGIAKKRGAAMEVRLRHRAGTVWT